MSHAGDPHKSGDHVPNQPFSAGLPCAPKRRASFWSLPVFPGDPNMNKTRSDILSKNGPLDAEISGFDNVSFLKKVTYNQHRIGGLPRALNMSEWEFEDRRQAQQILPFLFIGPAQAAKDEQFLKEKGITMVLLIRDLAQEISKLLTPKTAQKIGLETHILETRPGRIVGLLPIAIDKINRHLSECFERQERANSAKMDNREAPDQSLPGKVLVYDLTGNDAAAAVVGAYVMAMFNTLAGEAVFVVHARRFSISTHAVNEILVLYHDILAAKRDTLAAVRATTELQASLGSKGKKRELAVDEATTAMQGFAIDALTTADVVVDDVDQSRGRHSVAPFSDQPRLVLLNSSDAQMETG